MPAPTPDGGDVPLIAARPMPARAGGASAWLRRELFGGPFSTLVTVLLLAGLAWLLPALADWAPVSYT
ncbi:MAG: hypothetical protein AB9M60_10080, partial [Leptothrix sp. (in: b-proteobacteria)]